MFCFELIVLCYYLFFFFVFFFKQKTAYEMRISDWSSDVCSSDLLAGAPHCHRLIVRKPLLRAHDLVLPDDRIAFIVMPRDNTPNLKCHSDLLQSWVVVAGEPAKPGASSEPGSFSVGSSVS